MKKIICLFLMATTLSLAFAPAVANVENSRFETVKLSDTQTLAVYGGVRSVSDCAILIGGLAVGGTLIGGLVGTVIGAGVGTLFCLRT